MVSSTKFGPLISLLVFILEIYGLLIRFEDLLVALMSALWVLIDSWIHTESDHCCNVSVSLMLLPAVLARLN